MLPLPVHGAAVVGTVNFILKRTERSKIPIAQLFFTNNSVCAPDDEDSLDFLTWAKCWHRLSSNFVVATRRKTERIQTVKDRPRSFSKRNINSIFRRQIFLIITKIDIQLVALSFVLIKLILESIFGKLLSLNI